MTLDELILTLTNIREHVPGEVEVEIQTRWWDEWEGYTPSLEAIEEIYTLSESEPLRVVIR